MDPDQGPKICRFCGSGSLTLTETIAKLTKITFDIYLAFFVLAGLSFEINSNTVSLHSMNPNSNNNRFCKQCVNKGKTKS
jgi:hypothetical protein